MKPLNRTAILSFSAAALLSSCAIGGYVGPAAPTVPLPLYSLEESHVRLGEFSVEWKGEDIAFAFAMESAFDVEVSFKTMNFHGHYLVKEDGEEKLREVSFRELDPQEGKGALDYMSGEASMFFTGFAFEGEKLSSDPYRLSLKEGRNELIFKTSGENWRLDPTLAFNFNSYIESKGGVYTLFGGAFALDEEDLPAKNANFSYAWLSDVNIEEAPAGK